MTEPVQPVHVRINDLGPYVGTLSFQCEEPLTALTGDVPVWSFGIKQWAVQIPHAAYHLTYPLLRFVDPEDPEPVLIEMVTPGTTTPTISGRAWLTMMPHLCFGAGGQPRHIACGSLKLEGANRLMMHR